MDGWEVFRKKGDLLEGVGKDISTRGGKERTWSSWTHW